MDTKNKVCHDLKTERTDVAPPLPAVASALPIAFYLACVGAVGLNIMFWMNTKAANEDRDKFKQTETSETRLKGETVASISALSTQEKRANDVLEWVSGSRSFQPLIVAIANSIDAQVAVVDLDLKRGTTDPKQISMSIKFEGLTNDRSQVEDVEEALLGLGYRTYGARQTRGQTRGSLAYEATLLWNENTLSNLTSNTTQDNE